ncbi:MAG TPA: ferritin-like domain-containing protein [Candidatus Acidoferrales bacterium]|nr:ferritin-like domain-containing protein [Candidatus Acidoferrales bacterium]
MEALIELSRAVAADLAAEFRDDPHAELAAWLHIALEREAMVASLYQEQSVESRLKSLPKSLARSTIAKVNAICANEEAHVTVIRALLAADCPWPQLALTEGWGRLQGIVLSQLAGSNAFAQLIALILLELGARSERERAAGKTLARLDAGGFLKFSRTLEVTAVESYQRVATLLAALRRAHNGSLSSLALDLKILGILRDERVHRDVFHVLHRAFGGDGAHHSDGAEATELPDSITTLPISSPAELNAACRAILTFHYGAALPANAPPQEAMRVAVDYWRWQMENPFGKSYLVECQRENTCGEADILLLGTAGLGRAVRGVRATRPRRVDQQRIAALMAEHARLIRRSRRVEPRRSKDPKRRADAKADKLMKMPRRWQNHRAATGPGGHLDGPRES